LGESNRQTEIRNPCEVIIKKTINLNWSYVAAGKSSKSWL